MGYSHRVHTEWQQPLSGVHSILMEKLAHAGEGVPPPCGIGQGATVLVAAFPVVN